MPVETGRYLQGRLLLEIRSPNELNVMDLALVSAVRSDLSNLGVFDGHGGMGFFRSHSWGGIPVHLAIRSIDAHSPRSLRFELQLDFSVCLGVPQSVIQF